MSASHDGHELSFWRKYIFSTDHKMIGRQYFITGLLMTILGGFLSYVFRMQLAFPGQPIPGFGVLSAAQYNQFTTMHGTIMIFWVAMPLLVAAMGNFLIPVLVGADDMAFPTLNMISYWVFFLSTVVLISSFFVTGGAFGGGWTAYPPLSASGYTGQTGFSTDLGPKLWVIAVALEFVAFLIGGINFLVTTINMRAKGLTWFRMPIILWMFILAVLIFMFSVGPLIAGAIMLFLDQTAGTGFFNPAAGGDPILYQHLFWFFGHPEVYVILLPSLGFVAEVITTFARKPIFGYKTIVISSIIASALSMLVWAHHQFVSGIDPRMADIFTLTTIMISVPFAIIFMSLIATLFKGSIQYTTAMLFAVGFIAEFLVGGATGLFLGSSVFDMYAHGTYFVIAHFHYTLIPTVLFGGSTGTYYWFSKFTGRMMNETLGKIHFWLSVIGFNGVFIPLFFGGMLGEQRRIFDYSLWPSLMTPELIHIRVFATYAAIVLLTGQLVFLFNVVYSFFKGEKAVENPWKANSLEWTLPSPPPHGNFAQKPVVYRGAYEYSVEGRSEDYWPQNAPAN